MCPPISAARTSSSRYFPLADRALLSHQYDKAIAHYLKGINYADYREITKIWDDLGYAYLQKKETKNAITYLKNAISAYPDNFDCHFYLAIAYFFNDEIDLAYEELDKIEKNIRFDDGWMKEIFDSEIRRIDGGKISEEEVRRLKKEKGIYVHKSHPSEDLAPLVIISIDSFDEKNEGVFYFAQGIVHKRRMDFKEAEKKFLASLKAHYDEKQVRLQLLDLYREMDEHAKAEEQSVNLGKISGQKKDDAKPILTSQSIHPIEFRIHHRLREHPNNLLQSFHEKFLEEIEKARIQESINILEKALDIDESSYVVNHNLALLYFDKRNMEKAEIYCARALWFKEDHSGCHDLMGNIYFHQYAYKNALDEFKRMLEIGEQKAHAHYNLGLVYYMLNDWINAEMHWKESIECEKEKLKTQAESPFVEKDLQYSLVVRKISPSYLSHKSLGNLYYRQGKIDKAILELEKAIELRPHEAEPYLELGEIYLKREEREKAVFYLEKYLYLGGKKKDEAEKLLDQLKRKSVQLK